MLIANYFLLRACASGVALSTHLQLFYAFVSPAWSYDSLQGVEQASCTYGLLVGGQSVSAERMIVALLCL